MPEDLPKFCGKCGKPLHAMAGDTLVRCPSCGAEYNRPATGVVGRMIRRLFGRRVREISRSGPHVVRTVTSSQEFRVQDSTTGEVKVYRSLDELPPEVRQRIEALRGPEGLGSERPAAGVSKYTYRDPSGMEQIYRSLEEMPPEVRRLFERGRRQ